MEQNFAAVVIVEQMLPSFKVKVVGVEMLLLLLLLLYARGQ
jgi:hypothetical protein